MSYQERQAIVSVISTIVISVGYSAYMVQHYPQADPFSEAVFRFWGSFFVILIPVSIVVRIAITILFSIINTVAASEGEPEITDERDTLFALKSSRNALYVFSAGFLLAMGSAALGLSPSVMFILLLATGIGSDIIFEISQFYFYRRGF